MIRTVNLSLNKGTDFLKRFEVLDENLDPVDISGSVFVSKIRKNFDSRKFYSLGTTISGTETGVFYLTMNSVDSLYIPQGNYVYDVLVINNNNKTKLYEGIVYIQDTASR
jgi:hypothetical protein